MPNSNYPNGFSGGVSIRNVPITQTNPGLVFWVSNNTTGLLAGQRGGSDGNKGTFDSPFATLSYAMTQCIANRGDIIFIKPGHAETIIAAGTIALGVAGVAIVGLGYGAARPTFTYTTIASAAITVTAANISVQNCVFTANILSTAAAFTVSTAKNFTVQACLFQDTDGTHNFLNCIKSTGAANTADGLTVTDSVWNGTGTTSVNSMVLIADANINVTLLRNRCVLERTADAAILLTVTTGASTGLEIGDNIGISKQATTANGSLAKLNASSTGSVYRNYAGTLQTTTDALFTTNVGVYPYENRVSGVVGATGFVIPAVDS
jgi:hypothetical protein